MVVMPMRPHRSSGFALRVLLLPIGVGIPELVACGSNNADVPPGLVDAIRNSHATNTSPDGGGVSSNYPAGPYGTRVGDVVQDLCFQGWWNPSSENYDPAHLDKICFSDFHDDQAAKVLLVESAAVWCVACRFEYGGSGNRPSLSTQFTNRKAQGFRILGTLFQKADSQPATAEDASSWASTYSLEFPFAVDDEDQLGLFRPSTIAPFNVLVDTRTMKILLEVVGDQPDVLFGKVVDLLGTPAK